MDKTKIDKQKKKNRKYNGQNYQTAWNKGIGQNIERLTKDK